VQKPADFHLGADVVASDGRKVGTLARIIVEQDGFDARALVVKEEESFAGRLLAAESLFITDEVVVPITAVESATHDLVKLSMPAADVRRQPPYLSHHFKQLTADTAVLEEADVLCAPSLRAESFGMVLTEAFAAGTPVVASDIAGYRDVVRDGVDGLLVPAGDAQAVAEALRLASGASSYLVEGEPPTLVVGSRRASARTARSLKPLCRQIGAEPGSGFPYIRLTGPIVVLDKVRSDPA